MGNYHYKQGSFFWPRTCHSWCSDVAKRRGRQGKEQKASFYLTKAEWSKIQEGQTPKLQRPKKKTKEKRKATQSLTKSKEQASENKRNRKQETHHRVIQEDTGIMLRWITEWRHHRAHRLYTHWGWLATETQVITEKRAENHTKEGKEKRHTTLEGKTSK